MEKLQSKKQINLMAWLFAVTYLISYMTRINYGAIIAEMETATSFSRTLLSMALTGSFITYGIGQIIVGFLGDKFPPKRLISLGLIVTIIMNILIVLCKNPYQMCAVWCVNGFAQSFMWPPMVKMLTVNLTMGDYKNVATKVSWGSSFGSIAVYLFSPIIISLTGNWKFVFVVSAVCGLIMLFAWEKLCVFDVKNIKTESTAEVSEKGNIKHLFTPMMLFIMLAVITQGMLRDGVQTWMPSFIAETYGLSNEISILTGVVLPIFTIICLTLAKKLYQKQFTNPITCAAVFFIVGTLSALVIYTLNGLGAVFAVGGAAVLTGSMHGVNLMLICMVPAFFGKYGISSFASGVINACTYIGSAISSYGIAILSEKMGWSFTVLSWVMIAFIGAMICLSTKNSWAKKFGTNS